MGYTLSLDGETKENLISFERMVFPAGECHIKLKSIGGLILRSVTIETRIRNGSDVMELLLATDALQRSYKGAAITLSLPYIPYSRQDRPMIEGEPFSLKVFANLINSPQPE